MKIGDLVRFDFKTQKWAPNGYDWTGMIIEVGVYVGRKDVKVLWQDGSVQTDKSRRLEVINESR
jgi:hypothetical protein